MRNKRFLSTVVAMALVASTMAMPVMAADGGSFEVDVTTKTGVLRVTVPTSMAVAVDQFEIKQAGAQIASEEFKMTNLSEMDVKVGVTSTVTLGNGITLASAKDATEGNQAWLGVAAMTADSSYDDSTTDGVTEGYQDLSETNANVTSFATADGASKAEQTFYLSKGTGNAAHKLVVPAADGKVSSVSYTQFYELEALSSQPGDNETLQTAVDDNDIYVVVTANVGDDGTTVTKIDKGSEVDDNTWANTDTYYTAKDEPAAVSADGKLTAGKIYVYSEMGTEGGKAGFTYVGKLSEERETWTSEDISKINIAYTIAGVTASRYQELNDANELTYGLYNASTPVVTGPSITSGATAIETPGVDGATYGAILRNGTATEIEFNLPEGMSIQKVYANGNPASLTTENASIVTASGNKVTLLGNSSWATSAAGTVKYIKVVVDKGDETTQDFIIKITCN